MAFGVTAYSGAAFSAEDNNVIAYPQGIVLTGSMGEESNTGDANLNVTGIQATFSIGQSVAGTSALVSVTGSQLTTAIGDEVINIVAPITGQELSISNKEFTQDTLTAFAQAPFGALSPSTFEVPIVDVFTTTGAGTLPSFLLQSTLGTFSVSADGNVSVVVTEHTMNTSIGGVSVTGIANVPVTGSQMTMTLGGESAFTDHTVAVTGQQLTMSIGEETSVGNADAVVTGISLTSTIGNVSLTANADVSVTGISSTLSQGTAICIPNSLIDVTGNQLSTFIGQVETFDASAEVTGMSASTSIGSVKITSWQEVDPGVSNGWSEVDLAA